MTQALQSAWHLLPPSSAPPTHPAPTPQALSLQHSHAAPLPPLRTQPTATTTAATTPGPSPLSGTPPAQAAGGPFASFSHHHPPNGHDAGAGPFAHAGAGAPPIPLQEQGSRQGSAALPLLEQGSSSAAASGALPAAAGASAMRRTELSFANQWMVSGGGAGGASTGASSFAHPLQQLPFSLSLCAFASWLTCSTCVRALAASTHIICLPEMAPPDVKLNTHQRSHA